MDAIFRTGFFIALALLVFLAGSITALRGITPGPEIGRAIEGGMALYGKTKAKAQDVYGSDLWYPERNGQKGVTSYVQGKAQEGITLFTAGDAAAAYLIDMEGRVLHEWRRPFSTVWKSGGEGVKEPMPDSHIYFRHAQAFPNGDLLAIYEGVGDTPYGYGVVKLDRDSNVIWSYPGRAHHQFDVAPDGKIYVLTQEITNDNVDMVEHLKRPRLEDFLVILSPEGKELKKIRLLSSMVESRFRHILYTVSGFALGDPLHANAVEFIDQARAANFAFGKEGQVMLSFREANGIVVIDPETEEITWATRGPWIGQHDADILPNGNIMLFDNYANYNAPGGTSRVLEFDPRTMGIVWQYGGTPDHPLESRIRADQQRLANGNTLITESSAGRVVEVTPSGEIVWEFVNPVRGGADGKKIPIVAWSQRLDPSTFDPTLLNPQQQAQNPETEADL